MGYTALKVSEAGVVLFDAHRRRLGVAWERAFDEFAARAEPGIYGLKGVDGQLEVTRRDRSRLWSGIPVRYLPSPVVGRLGPQEKTPSPSAWDGVRQEGVATLLTSADGEELYESCAAAVLAWDGRELVATPEASPRVASITEPFLLARHAHRRAAIRRRDGWAVVLVNAVAGACVPKMDGAEFPAGLLEELNQLIAASARRSPG
ncbi:MAG: hypothetical protein AB1938_31100 [Myxococcota bacterium]